MHQDSNHNLAHENTYVQLSLAYHTTSSSWSCIESEFHIQLTKKWMT